MRIRFDRQVDGADRARSSGGRPLHNLYLTVELGPKERTLLDCGKVDGCIVLRSSRVVTAPTAHKQRLSVVAEVTTFARRHLLGVWRSKVEADTAEVDARRQLRALAGRLRRAAGHDEGEASAAS